MAELKTKKTTASVAGFIGAIKDDERRKDCETVVRLMKKATKSEPAMWGSSIVGFGTSSYRLASGQEMPWFFMGFSPRKGPLTLYVPGGTKSKLLDKLGKHKTSKYCLYLSRLADVDLKVLEDLIATSAKKA